MKSLYDSAWHLPGTAWFATAAFLVVLLGRSGGHHRRLFGALAGLIALDAWLNGPLSPLAGAPPWLGTVVGLAFVLAGDFRFFLLAERALGGAHTSVLRRAVALTVVVPILSIPLRLAHVPDRVLWLSYETAFAVLAAVLRFGVFPRRAPASAAGHERLAAATALASFELVQYGLWATADVLLLAGMEVGWLVRIVPNTLYYAAFVPFAWWWTQELPAERAA
jgi:hypothetical protein